MNYEIEPYKSTYPIAYYDIGTVYSFYGRRECAGAIAPEMYVKQYAYLLDQLEDEESNNVIKSVQTRGEKSTSMIRYYGVVVDKSSDSYPSIKVMTLNIKDGCKIYQIKSYSVGRKNTEAISTDGKNLMTASAKADIEITGNISTKVTSGITRVDKANTNKSVTGVTRVPSEVKSQPKGVSGVTRLYKEAVEVSHVANEISSVTGITRAKSVSGITRTNNSVSGITRVRK